MAILAVAIVGAAIVIAYLFSEARELRNEVSALEADKESLETEVDAIGGDLNRVQDDLGDANAVVASCRKAVESGQELAILFGELSTIDDLWWETEEGSVEEAELDAAAVEVDTALQQSLGRFATQAEACLPSGQPG